MLIDLSTLRRPGLFVTATDTGVGKTVVTCAIAAALRRSGTSVGVCKPCASGCRRDREGLVSEDAEALAHFADCRLPLDVINPIRYAAPLAPAVAAEQAGQTPDVAGLSRSLARLDEASDVLLIEGIGGLLVPLWERDDPKRGRVRYVTVLDLAAAIGYPVLVVARAGLGTLNHTAMTVRLLRENGCRVAGIVINGYDADAAKETDPSVSSNRTWLEKLTGVPVLATVPRCAADLVAPQHGRLPAEILETMATVDWRSVVAASNS